MKKITALFLAMMFIISTFGIQNVVAADNFNWNNLRAEYVYNSSRDELEIKIFLPNITRSPDERYELEVEIDNRDYDTRMSYSSSQDEVYATFDFDNINSSELEDYLDLDIVIEDEDEDEVFDGRIQMSSNGSMDHNNSSNNDIDIDWSEIETSMNYERNSNKLELQLEVWDVPISAERLANSWYYNASVTIDGRKYNQEFIYSGSKNILYSDFDIYVFSESTVKLSYNVKLLVTDRDGTVINKTVSVRTNKYTSSHSTTQTQTHTNTNTTTTISTQTHNEIQVKAYRYIYSVEQKFVSSVARTAYLNRTIAALESARYSLNATVVDGMIAVIRDRIASYNTWTTNSGNSNTGNTYIPTNKRVNKAESIRSDGKGGTFKYVGGYNY